MKLYRNIPFITHGSVREVYRLKGRERKVRYRERALGDFLGRKKDKIKKNECGEMTE